MTTLQRQQHNRIAHLSGEDLETLGRELDAIRQQVLDSRAERDADYIRNVIDFQRKLELGSRAVLLSSLFLPAWLAGTVGLSVAKIVENMEIGHNAMHGPVGLRRLLRLHRQDPIRLHLGCCSKPPDKLPQDRRSMKNSASTLCLNVSEAHASRQVLGTRSFRRPDRSPDASNTSAQQAPGS